MQSPVGVWTIGHDNRDINELAGLLCGAEIAVLVDVWAYPSSKRHPQFARSSLEIALAKSKIHYRWEGKCLGGFRKPKINSPNVALNSGGLNGYADYMHTPEFAEGISDLVGFSSKTKLAIICAERDPLQCHRSLIADYLTARGLSVNHILEAGVIQTHQMNTLARVVGENLVYDRQIQSQFDLT